MSKTPAQAAYEAWCAMGAIATMLSPSWEQLREDSRRSWERIAQAAIAASPVQRDAKLISDELTSLREQITELLDEPGIHPATYRVLTELLKEERQ